MSVRFALAACLVLLPACSKRPAEIGLTNATEHELCDVAVGGLNPNGVDESHHDVVCRLGRLAQAQRASCAMRIPMDDLPVVVDARRCEDSTVMALMLREHVPWDTTAMHLDVVDVEGQLALRKHTGAGP